MSNGIELDTVLASLVKPLGRCADTLLDFRKWATDERRAGACVKAYFDLVGEVSPGDEASKRLVPLRRWLETNLAISVSAGKCSDHLEVLPLTFAGESDLGEFCHAAMRRMREDRCLDVPMLHMEFCFVQDLAQAA